MIKSAAGSLALLFVSVGLAADAASFKLIKTIPIPGEGGWDYVSVDEAGRRVFVSHTSRVEVLDADSGEIKGAITETPGVHGIAIAADLGRGFTSNGRSNNVTVFDLKSLKAIGTVPTGRNPDSILYDPALKRVFAFNGGSANVTAIDAANSKVGGTLDLGGRPESAAADGAGNLFVNMEDKSEVVKFDGRDLKVLERWPLTPAKTPVSMAIDVANHRLFVGCRGNKSLMVINTDTGKVITSVPIGERVDASFFDPATKLIFSSCGDGTLSVIRQVSPDNYTSMETIKTRTGSKTMGYDPTAKRLFVPAAEFKATNGSMRPTVVPGTFSMMIYGQ
jgi:DNA-binding beta-propeller fold protein YncE